MRLIIVLCFWVVCSQAQTITLRHRESDDIRLSPLPISIKLKIDSIIISRIGNKFFNECVIYDSVKSGLYPGNPDYLQLNQTNRQYILGLPHLDAIYYFCNPNREWQKIEMKWRLDSLGNTFGDNYPNWIPDCITDSTQCIFSVDSLKAISIARLNGIPDDSKLTQAHFTVRWIENSAKIIWLVDGTVDYHKYIIVYIDSCTGEFLLKHTTQFFY